MKSKDGMNTTSATRISESKRPLVHRVARKWYSWAGLTLTMTASYLAFDGQLKVVTPNQLQAAPPPAADVRWSANPVPPEEPVTGPSLTLGREPEVMAVPRGLPKQLLNARVNQVLNAYKQGVARASYEEVQPGSDGPKIPVPSLPNEQLPTVPVNEPIEVIVPEPLKLDPIKPQGRGEMPNRPVMLPPRKLDMPTDQPATVKTEEVKPPVEVKNDKTLVQEVEQIPTKPTPEAVMTNEKVAAEVESLKPNERLLYESAQNTARMKDYAKTSDNFEQLLKMRPDLFYIRAEYAGIMTTAGELAKAIEQYKRVIEMKPDSVVYRIRLGDVYVIAKDYKQAIRHFSDALKTPPFEPEYAVRLARAYVFENDFNRAFQVFDRMLANIKPDDPKAPAAMGALLLDLDMPQLAMEYLLAKRTQIEKDGKRKEVSLLEVLCSLARGYARLGERQQAMDILQQIPALAGDEIGIRETLAAQLYGIEEFELAAQVYNQILMVEPTNGVAIIGMARIYLDMAQPATARQILDSFRPAPRQMRDYLSAYAVYHIRVGEYVEARQIYMDMLRRNENDHDIRVRLGKLYDFQKDESERAKAEFAKVPPLDANGREARRMFAEALAGQRKFLEAIEIDRLLLSEDPTDSATIAQTIRHQSKADLHEQAIGTGRGYLATGPRNEGHANLVRLNLAKALLKAGRHMEAIREAEILISRSSGRSVEAYYVLMSAHEKLGNLERSKQFLACMAGLPGGEFRNRLQLAELYAVDYDDNRAIEICMSLLGQDPKHLPTLIRLGDSQQRLSRFSGNPADVFQTGQSILSLSPSNVRGQFQMSRSFAVAQNFRKSAGQYDQLILLDPLQFAPRLERARILYADHQYSAARSAYQQILNQTPDELLRSNMSDAVVRSPKLQAILQPYLIGGIDGTGLRKELGRLSTAVPDPEVRLATHRLVCDYDGRLARNNAVELEMQALELKDYRQFQALGALRTSHEFEQTNTETLYGRGQQLGAMRYTNDELSAYSEVIKIDPTHRDAIMASERANAEMGPKLDASYSYFKQSGRQGLADITRQRYTVDGRVPLGDEDEYLMLGYQRANYNSPFNYPETTGNIPFLRVQNKFMDNRLLGYGQVNVEEYDNGFDTRPTFDIGAIYQYCDWIWLRGGGYLENVVENGESIRQDIRRGGAYVGADFRPTRIWAFGGEYRYGNYSDDNDLNSFTLYNELCLTQAPKLLKIAQRMYFWGFREQTVFPTNPPQQDNIFGAVHPYFAPSGYSQMELRVEWWHWLSRDYFVHSNQCWYSLQYGIMTDNNLVTFHNLRAILNYDVCTWLTVGGQADAQLSSVYNMYSAMAFLQIRFK